jgi:2-polyprenyl-6-methoxyphenol hydroxylase-like FAD-dependent oxidoreductase
MNGTAVVIGAGFAGMLSARACSNYFDQVIILEKDALLDSPRPRRGVAQGAQLHQPLAAATNILHEFFPNLQRDLTETGAQTINVSTSTKTFSRGQWMPRRDFGLYVSMQTRGLLEQITRRQLNSISNIEIRPTVGVVGLAFHIDRVNGVVIESNNGPRMTVSADFVVDASGRASRPRHWLTDLGYPEPASSRIDVDVRYVTCLVDIPKEFPDAATGIRMRAFPNSARSGTCLPVEDNRWIIMLSGRHGDYPPTDISDIVEFARSLPSSEIADRLALGSHVWDPRPYYFPFNIHWHYHKMERFPNRLLPIGDSVMSLNPLYGQGIAMSAIQAKVLSSELSARSGSSDGFAAMMLEKCADALRYPWRTAALSDFEFPQTIGERPATLTQDFKFARGLADLTIEDADAHEASVRVQQLLDPPELLLQRGIRERVMRRLAQG